MGVLPPAPPPNAPLPRLRPFVSELTALVQQSALDSIAVFQKHIDPQVQRLRLALRFHVDAEPELRPVYDAAFFGVSERVCVLAVSFIITFTSFTPVSLKVHA
jgi:hypothetical protein